MTIQLKPISLILLFVIYYGPAFAQSPVATRDLDSIFGSAIAAVGSARDIGNLRSIEARAYCDGPKGKYTTAISSFRENKTIFEQTYSYRDKPSSTFINGSVAWEKASDSGHHSLVSPFQRMAARSHEYQKMAFDFHNFFRDPELIDDEMFEGRPSTKVSSKNELGMTTVLYFDKETKRFSGYIVQIPNTSETIKNVILEWRKVGSLTLPSVVKAIDSQGVWTLNFHTIKLNTANEKLLEIPPRVADTTELMRLHEQQKTAHLTYNAELFVEMFADNVTQLQRGNAVTRSKAENLTRFKTYFSGYKFLEWEDIVPPVIKISKDGTMATIVVQKRVRGTYKNDKGEEESDHTIFAWIEVWEKIKGKWKVVTVASTEKYGPK